MNINNINAGAATMESPPIEASAPPVVSDIDPAVKTDVIQSQHPKEELQADKAVQAKESLSAQETEQITVDLNEYMNHLQTNLRFSMYEKLDHQVVVEIKNRQTDELIKQIPSEELLEIRVKMEELTGLLLDEKI
jgi:flagellar protein FlaG